MRSIRQILRASVVAITACIAAATLTSAASSSAGATMDSAQPKPTIVLVHGAWADGSSWAAVTAKLQREGFTVNAVPNPLRGVASDAQYLEDYLATVAGPVVLVGHSYGGMVITDAARENANVQALVYVDAYIPAPGETLEQLTGAQPGSELDPNTAINVVPLHDSAGDPVNADLYVKPALFGRLFTGSAPAKVSDAFAASQRPLAYSALGEPFAGIPAWQSIPSWVLIGTADRVLPPAQQQIMATRANAALVVRVNAPHLSMVTNPDAVAGLITTAARDS
jgi:pimeloyl-ACP methyl ester carboxylesterase